MSSELIRLKEVMDKLRSPGGCPWDAEQTHESLLKFLLEESYEFVDSVDVKDRNAMREELGDVLLQVYFHARIAEEHTSDPFTIEDIAKGITDKLIRRHPHVFGDQKVSGVSEVVENWEQLKAREKARNSAVDGVALSQPALPLVTKLIYRAEKIGINLDLPATDSKNETDIVDELVAAINAAVKNGIDPEDALRMRARAIADEIKSKEAR
ncbi:MAG: hypothetical protein RLZ57_1188 [Actinomycetota bacterium]|jgi:XTP/dITP diphosphohydrolase